MSYLLKNLKKKFPKNIFRKFRTDFKSENWILLNSIQKYKFSWGLWLKRAQRFHIWYQKKIMIPEKRKIQFSYFFQIELSSASSENQYVEVILALKFHFLKKLGRLRFSWGYLAEETSCRPQPLFKVDTAVHSRTGGSDLIIIKVNLLKLKIEVS